MEQAVLGSDLSSARRGAAAFLDNIADEDEYETGGRQNWFARWKKIGNDHYVLGDLNLKEGAFAEAAEAWLCALTAFEIARRLVNEADPQSEDVSAKVDGGIQRFRSSHLQKLEQVKIPCSEQADLPAYHLRAGSPDLPSSAIICISMEQETRATLLGRLLPVMIGRGVSALVVSHGDVSHRSRGQSETLLSHCLDYLAVRPEVDATRIGVYGEGLSAALATEFAASDDRLAAAVCDGGLWHWARIVASVGWMTRNTDGAVDHDVISARRTQILRGLKCPVLVVAGGRGIVDVSEALKLQADCMAARIDLELAIPRIIRCHGREIENFVMADDCVFGWLEQKLACSTAPQPLSPRKRDQ
ncbi:hypothetical protein IVB33_39275 [Bradyrhizobium sp. 24]|uniref:alpha/beta hydrolase family protein n=1 Tax=unclassified Bradyrhizobium TaxID=2631580 RepID=UPI001FF89EF5|nr:MULTISPECIES: hypothetical protein [unclassified Bradyrhizobium]MCK1299716.1 hypothetical protein [Bradyrhizobium sp. 37]MCK1382401.1 hypothetical protein [Bradyrhizobium sp. 24]MCK1771466.1 hypothetical protein [Bradyrhizobium sp. 134]